MKKFLLILFLGLISMTASLISYGQENEKYVVNLQSGKFVPPANKVDVMKNPSILKNSIFLNKYYVVIQFYEIPTQELNSKLKSLNIVLIDFLPKLAYTATIPDNFDFSMLKSLPIRSIFSLKTEQKMNSEFLEKKFPDWAIKVPGYLDVNMITFDQIPTDRILKELHELGGVVLLDQSIFKTFIIRISVCNVEKLAGLPFVQWVEPISPPDVITY